MDAGRDTSGDTINAVLGWQLSIAGNQVAPGAIVVVRERGQVNGSIFLVLDHPQTTEQSTFRVVANVNIGGKNYLLLNEQSNSEGELAVARLMDKERICAMDPDRFSSLQNALSLFLQAPVLATVSEMEKILGPLPLFKVESA